MGSYAIIGAHLCIANGAAWRAHIWGRRRDRCFFAMAPPHRRLPRALTFASFWKLPVVFVCENNLYMEYTPSAMSRRSSISGRPRYAYGLPRIVIDGNDAMPSTAPLRPLTPKRGRRGTVINRMHDLPTFGHSRADPGKIRPEGELERCGIRPDQDFTKATERIWCRDEQIAAIEDGSKAKVEAATAACKAAPPPSIDILTTDVYANGGWAWRN